MEQERKLRAGWLVVGVVAALVAAPIGAVAATSIVKIAGPSGRIAQVDPANRLQTAEWSPRSVVTTGFPELDTTQGCVTLFHVPATKALIVTQFVVVTKAAPSFDAGHGVLLFTESACGGAAVMVDLPPRVGTEVLPFEPGLPIPAAGIVSARAFGTGTQTEVEIRGYFVPKSSVG